MEVSLTCLLMLEICFGIFVPFEGGDQKLQRHLEACLLLRKIHTQTKSIGEDDGTVPGYDMFE